MKWLNKRRFDKVNIRKRSSSLATKIRHMGFTRTNPPKKDFGGFTIIEVTLFLAISGLLILIAFTSIGSNQKNAEFHDSMQSIVDFLNGQVNAIQSGVNDRSTTLNCSYNSGIVSVTNGTSPTPTGGSGGCTLLGRIYWFNDPAKSKITSYDVVGTVTPASGCTSTMAGPNGLSRDSSTPINDLLQYCPTVLGSNIFDAQNGQPQLGNSGPTYSYTWGNTLLNGVGRNNLSNNTFTATGTYQSVSGIGIFRDPTNNSIFPVVFESDAPNHTNSVMTTNINTQFCYKGGASYYGAIYLGGSFQNGANVQSGSNDLFNVKVDDPTCGQWGGVE